MCMKGSYQDEKVLVGESLVFADGGEHRQHQAAEHQQKTETQAHTGQETHLKIHTSEIRTLFG